MVDATLLEAAGQLDAAVAEYRRLVASSPASAGETDAVRRAALVQARELARVGRSLAGAPQRLPALEALRLLEYGFVALAQDPVDAPTVPAAGELDAALLRGDAGRWLRDVLYGDV